MILMEKGVRQLNRQTDLRLQFGHWIFVLQNRCIMDCKMDEKGVTPIPVEIKTACFARKTSLAGAPKGPLMCMIKGSPIN